MKAHILFVLLLLPAVLLAAEVELTEERHYEASATSTITIEHALQEGVFTHRGTVTLGSGKNESPKLVQNSLSPAEVALLDVCSPSPPHVPFLLKHFPHAASSHVPLL
jgi:hypothetical protein